MKVCVLATSYPRYKGDHASVFVHGLSKGLAAKGLEVKAVVPHEKGLPLKDVMDGVQIFRFRYFWPSFLEQVAYGYGIPDNIHRKFWAKVGLPFFVIFFLIKSWRQCRDCDVIHAHWEISALIAIIISFHRKIPVVLTVHRIVARNKFTRWLTRQLFIRIDVLHFNSSFTQSQVENIVKPLPSHEIIYPSVDIDFFKPGEPKESFRKKFGISENASILLGLGRLVEKKGFCHLIEAFSLLGKRNSNSFPYILVIGGGGPLLNDLKSQAKDTCPLNSVFFTDFLLPKEILSLLRESTLMVAPSIFDSRGEVETLGVVIMEAMACQVPVIGSRVGGIPDIIEDGISGVFVEPANPKDLAEKMELLLKDVPLRQRLALAGMENARKKFSWAYAIQATLDSYSRLLEEK